MLSCLESAVPLMAGPLLSMLYNATIVSFPGATYCAMAAISALMGMIFIAIRLMSRDGMTWAPLVDEEEEDEAGEGDSVGHRASSDAERAPATVS